VKKFDDIRAGFFNKNSDKIYKTPSFDILKTLQFNEQTKWSDNNPPNELIEYEDLRRNLKEVLDTLSDREKNVLILRFGLDDGRPRTLEEIGGKMGVTRERIRQIEEKALKKLRHPSRSKKLRDFLK